MHIYAFPPGDCRAPRQPAAAWVNPDPEPLPQRGMDPHLMPPRRPFSAPTPTSISPARCLALALQCTGLRRVDVLHFRIRVKG